MVDWNKEARYLKDAVERGGGGTICKDLVMMDLASYRKLTEEAEVNKQAAATLRKENDSLRAKIQVLLSGYDSDQDLVNRVFRRGL